MDEDFSNKQKTSDDIDDPGGNNLMTRHVIRVHVMLQRSSRGATSLHTVYLSTIVPVIQLKTSLEHMLKVPNACQRWLFKNTELDNNETIGGSNIRANDYIHVQIEKQDHLAFL